MKCLMSRTDAINKNWCLILFFHFYLKSLDLPKFSITDVSHINMLPYETPGILTHSLVFKIDVKMFASRTDILIKIDILTTPLRKVVRSENLCTLKLSEEPNFRNLG